MHESEESNTPPLYNAKMEIIVTECLNVFCNDEVPLSSVNVSLYDMNPIDFPVLADLRSSGATDENGTKIFNAVNDSLLFLYIQHDGQKYLEKIIVAPNAKSFHFPRFSPFCDLVGTELVNCQ